MVRGCGNPYEYPRRVIIYLDIHSDIRAYIRMDIM